MDEFTFDTDIFAEINDSQAEIFDVIEEEKFDVEKYINGETDYWYQLRNFSSSITFSMLRKITTHPESSIRFTPNCKKITQQLNEYRRANGEVSLKEMARIFGLRERNCAAYYYGTHYFMGGPGNCRSWQQMRRGACVDIWGSLRYLVGGELVTLTLSH